MHKITVMILSDSGKKLKFINAVLIAGLLVSCAFGIWHFFIPYQFRWYSYIPSAPKEIIVSVDWINFFFSLFLTGNSLMLLLFYKRIIEKEIVCFSFYGFLTFVWLTRIVITIVHPWNYDFMWAIQLSAFIIVFMLLALPFTYILLKLKTRYKV